MKSYKYVVIVGCGALGAMLANQLSALGINVVVVDRDEAAFNNLSQEFSGFRVVGDAAEMAVLRSARITQADCVLTTTSSDNVNLMVAEVARSLFEVPKVIARIYDPEREALYHQFGIETVCPTRLASDGFLTALGHALEAGQR